MKLRIIHACTFSGTDYVVTCMGLFLINISEASATFDDLAARVLRVFESQRHERVDQVSLSQAIEGINRFFAIATELDDGSEITEPLTVKDVSQLGDHGLILLTEFDTWVQKLKIEDGGRGTSQTILATADWIVRHKGQIQTLEPVVDALAFAANNTTDPEVLERLTYFMGTIVVACANIIKGDLEKFNPGRPWRVLHLNRGIVATRSLKPELMSRVFDELLAELPEDAPQFFYEGMLEIDRVGYPPQVREVMQRYFDRWSRPKMH